jgi:hypothetical protein
MSDLKREFKGVLRKQDTFFIALIKSVVSLRLSKTKRAKAFTLMLRVPQHDSPHLHKTKKQIRNSKSDIRNKNNILVA